MQFVRSLIGTWFSGNSDHRDAQGNTPLMKAAVASKGDVEMIKMTERLLDGGAQVNARNNYGWTALMKAASAGRSDVVKLLYEHGASVNLTIEEEKAAKYVRGRYVFPRHKKGDTALTIAAREHDFETVSFLIWEAGADITIHGEETATEAAAGHWSIKQVLHAEHLRRVTAALERDVHGVHMLHGFVRQAMGLEPSRMSRQRCRRKNPNCVSSRSIRKVSMKKKPNSFARSTADARNSLVVKCHNRNFKKT